jgi:DNA modification methylase
MKRVTLINADCATALTVLGEGSIDAIVTDPPYEIALNGKHWDRTGIAFNVAMWERAHRALRPGGYLLAFGATRTYHHLVAALEAAGFLIDDCLSWLYGSGFPKHRSKLKPAWEPVVMARKKSTAATPLNIDECREDLGGRWPANVLFDLEAAEVLDADTPGREKPSRFFYIAKPSAAEREEGLEHTRLKKRSSEMLSSLKGAAKPRRNYHPTVKPIALMRHLVRLVTPGDGVVLDPFTGSGTTGCAAMLEQRRFVGIERERPYFAIAEARIRHFAKVGGGL